MTDAPRPTTITEGASTLFVYNRKDSDKGPATREDLPFYNPTMQLNRDTSILIVQQLLNHSTHEIKILDGLAASGIRGIRLANEVIGNYQIILNDISVSAYELIQQNIRSNDLTAVTATNENIHTLLAKDSYHYIDIDPFGSPITFLDDAIRALKHQGILAITATDSATLCGVYPKVCWRRYAAKPHHSPMMHETGIRILLGATAREAAKYDKGITPLLSYYDDHYFRCYLRISGGKNRANESMKHYRHCDLDNYSSKPTGRPQIAGPLWMGPLYHMETLKELLKILPDKTLGTQKRLERLLEQWTDEAPLPPHHYINDIIACNTMTDPPRLDKIDSLFLENGYRFVKTHYGGGTFKTDASYPEVCRIFKEYHQKQQKDKGVSRTP